MRFDQECMTIEVFVDPNYIIDSPLPLRSSSDPYSITIEVFAAIQNIIIIGVFSEIERIVLIQVLSGVP